MLSRPRDPFRLALEGLIYNEQALLPPQGLATLTYGEESTRKLAQATRSTCEQRLCSAEQSAWVYQLERSGRDHGWDLLADALLHSSQSPSLAPLQPLTSSSLRLCSFCSSIRFCRSASSCRLCSSFSLCCCSSCCRRRASERSLLASCSRRKSRRSVDSPGRLRMELHRRKAPRKVPHTSLRLSSRGRAPHKHVSTQPCFHRRDGEKGWATSIGAGQCQVQREFHTTSSPPSLFFLNNFVFFLNRNPEADKALLNHTSWPRPQVTNIDLLKDSFTVKFLTKVPRAAVAGTIFSCSQSTFSMNHCQLLKHYIISGK